MICSKCFQQLTTLVQPSLVAIYASHSRRPTEPVQIGTGFLVAHSCRPVLVTAEHVLRGHNWKENPGDKAVHIGGSWVYIGDGNGPLASAKDYDIAAIYMDGFPLSRCLSPSSLSLQPLDATAVTIGGYLARDFKREGHVLRPAPYIYSNRRLGICQGFVGLRYPKRRNIYTVTSKPAVTPIPSGLSGCPMMDTIELIRGCISILGVFTDQGDGKAWGVDSNILRALLNSL